MTEPTPEPQPPKRRRLRRVLTAAAIAGMLSLLLRVAVADLWWWSKWNFYLPLVILAPLTFLATAAMEARLRWRAAAALLVLMLGAVSALREKPRSLFIYPDSDGATFSLLAWNVMGYAGGEQAIVDRIAAEEPDVLCLVEGTFGGHAPPKLSKKLGKAYRWAVGDGLSIASRFPIESSRMIAASNGVRALLAVINFDGKRAAVVAVDIKPPLRRHDAAAYAELAAALGTIDLPVAFAGDFNTPRGSIWLRRALGGYGDAFQRSDRGEWLATWPARMPLWHIDHILHSPSLHAKRAVVLPRGASDHLPVRAEFTVE